MMSQHILTLFQVMESLPWTPRKPMRILLTMRDRLVLHHGIRLLVLTDLDSRFRQAVN